MIRASIVVTAYNAAPFISCCLNSLLNQTEPGIEIIVVNDGSTDQTPSVVDNYAIKDQRIKVIHQKNRGVSAARNVGLNAATGKYVCFIDGDDWVETTMIEDMVKVCESVDAEVVIAGAFVDFHNHADKIQLSELRSLPQYSIHGRRALNSNLVDSNFINLLGYVWNKLYNREWLVGLSEPFEEGLDLFEDMDFNCRVLSRAGHVIFIPQAYVHYIQRPRRSLGSHRETNFLGLHSRTIDRVDFLLQSWGVDEDTRRFQSATAGATALWSGLRVAIEVSNPRKALIQLLEYPGTTRLIVKPATVKSLGWRGMWATFTITRGWYRIALLPLLILKTVKNLPPFASGKQ